MKPKGIITIISFIILCNSCIWENRSDCPVFLSFDLSQIRNEVNKIDIWIMNSKGDIVYYDSLQREKFKTFYEIPLEKTQLQIYCWGNIGRNGLLEECKGTLDSLYLYRSIIHPSGEFYSETIIMHREFVKIYLYILSYPDQGSTMSVSIEGSTIGYDIDYSLRYGHLLATKSPFQTYHETGKWYKYDFMIPRQETPDNMNIILTLYKNGEYLSAEKFPIGDYVSGYMNSTQELRDIHIVIDYSRLSMEFYTDDWIFDPTNYIAL